MFYRRRQYGLGKVPDHFTNHLLLISLLEAHVTGQRVRAFEAYPCAIHFLQCVHILPVKRRNWVETMDEEVMEFGIAHSRKYSRDHLWYQEKDDRLVIGLSDYLAADIGEVLRVILPHAETEVDEEQNLFSIWTADEKLTFPSPFAGQIAEVNGEVEINPDLVNDSPYDLGWVIILDPHDVDMENLLEPDEYVDFLAES
ncbi:MAG: hypothetical protein CMA11_06220 [Euryarchaeota archaeon]|nr:hypothetical protein [Euryarchaeota archaeon]